MLCFSSDCFNSWTWSPLCYQRLRRKVHESSITPDPKTLSYCIQIFWKFMFNTKCFICGLSVCEKQCLLQICSYAFLQCTVKVKLLFYEAAIYTVNCWTEWHLCELSGLRSLSSYVFQILALALVVSGLSYIERIHFEWDSDEMCKT